MIRKISLTAQSIQLLFNAASKCQWPKRLGTGTNYDLEWDDQARGKNMLLISRFRSAIREKYAIKIGNDWVVGAEANWRPKAVGEKVKPSGDGRYELVDKYVVMDLELEDEAWNAMYWLCLWLSHPASPGFTNAGHLDEIVYPLVEEIEEWDQLMYDLGLREEEPVKVRANG